MKTKVSRHHALDYEEAFVHFIYSFTWDISRVTWESLVERLSGVRTGQAVGGQPIWHLRLLHERTFRAGGAERPTYQPSLVTNQKVLETTGGAPVECVIPMEPYTGFQLRGHETLQVGLLYTIRLFDNGSATCTFAAHLEKGSATFERIHWLLHLTQNIDPGDQSSPALPRRDLTAAFLSLPSKGDNELALPFPVSTRESLTYDQGYCSLHDLFRRFLSWPSLWRRTLDSEDLWNDKDVLYWNDVSQDFQSPFVFTAATVSTSSMDRIEGASEPSAKELASITCKFTLDNRYIARDFEEVSTDYMRRVLGVSESSEHTFNFSLDRRLFFTFTRRGAIALTKSFADIPASFVVPSLLNLLELLRVRWHMSTVINARLDDMIKQLVPRVRTAGQYIDPGVLLDTLFKWRSVFALFLRDPVPFLFDGGSVTEIAEIADRELWLSKLRDDTHQKFATVDRLVQDLLERVRIDQLLKTHG